MLSGTLNVKLSLLYSNLGQDMINSYINNFTTGIYWSSTESSFSDSHAWGMNFGDGTESGSATVTWKNDKKFVRPIRAF